MMGGMTMPKIGFGIICYNEQDFIEPCLRGLLPMAEKIIISDGTMNGTNVDPGQRNATCEASDDRTRDIIERFRERNYGKIERFYVNGSPIPTERELRNIHLAMCDGCDWFMICDADEVWCAATARPLLELINQTTADTITLRNKLFFHDPFHHFLTKHTRLFRMRSGLEFIGNNEVNLEGEKIIAKNVCFHHYGYIDPDKVKFKMDLYGSQTFYRGCGPWWYENIFQAFDGRNATELYQKNYGTLHPWGKIHPGFAADEFVLISKPSKHPTSMRQYFNKRGFIGVAYEV
jgi:glycosyltransferase involved in cell wall biosynthesis